MNKEKDGCTCKDWFFGSSDRLLHACGTILCERVRGFAEKIAELSKKGPKDVSRD